jgi:pimeloyl-ACP methyl ester carboxylesterase
MTIHMAAAPDTAAPDHYSLDSVASKDGTSIHYRQLGHGPGIVLLHGSMESAASHMGLAEALADTFTVYLPERRGHSLKDIQGKPYSIRLEVEDVDALLRKTEAHYVFGVSAGGLIALQAGMTLPNAEKIAVYEPALIMNGNLSMAFLTRYDREIAEGKIAAALITGMIGAKLGSAFFNLLPRPLMESMTSKMLKSEDATAKPGDVTMRMLAPTLHYDFALVAEMADKLDTFKTMPVEVLLMSGTKSPAWLKAVADALGKVLPKVKRVEFPGLDHGGSSDPSSTNRSGNPALVAQAMREFFNETPSEDSSRR